MEHRKFIDALGETIEYYQDSYGLYHREDGPAAINHTTGFAGYWIHGKRHRLNGPAITHHDGTQAWYIYGMRWDI